MKFNLEDVAIIFDRLSNFYSQTEVENWKSRVKADVEGLFLKYEIQDYKINKNSYMGIAIECNSQKFGNLFIKIVPPMTGRFESETKTLSLLDRSLVCKIYEVDSDKSAIVMEKVTPGTLAEFYQNRDAYKTLFEKTFENRICVSDDIRLKFKNFKEVVDYDYAICLRKEENVDFVNKLYNKFCETYSKLEAKAQYLLHGDIYKNNAIMNELGDIILIDPLGFIAPFVIELTPICAYEMFYSEGNCQKIFEEFSEFFRPYATKEEYADAMFCELVKVYIPSLYEANDGGIRANRWLELLNELYPEIVKSL